MGHQAAIAAQPGECALDHPAAAQDLEAALLVGAFDDFQLEGQPDELARELGSGIATVSKDLFQARIFLERPLDQTSGTVAIPGYFPELPRARGGGLRCRRGHCA